MEYYYHATSYENAQKIEIEGFRLSRDGMFGSGIYFSEKPEEAVKKARINKCDSIITVTLDVGRLLTEEIARPHYNLRLIKKIGYDSVQMTHCRTGAEICIYEPFRAKIVSVIHWDDSTIEFKGENLKTLNLNDFKPFLNGRTMILNPPNQEPPTYQDISTDQIIAKRIKRLDDLESFILDRKNRVIYTESYFIHVSDYCMKTVHDYLQKIVQLHNEFPHLKSELDRRIQNLIRQLKDQTEQDQQMVEFTNFFAGDIISVSTEDNSCTPDIIRILNNFLRNYQIEGNFKEMPDYE